MYSYVSQKKFRTMGGGGWGGGGGGGVNWNGCQIDICFISHINKIVNIGMKN